LIHDMRGSRPKTDSVKHAKVSTVNVTKKEVEKKKPLANSVFTFAQQIN